MARTSTLLRFLPGKTTAKLLLLLLFISVTGFTQAQSGSAVTIFKETVGTDPVGDFTISSYQANKSFDSDNLIFSGNGWVWDFDNSEGYTGASGVNNISLYDGEQFLISGINTLNYTGLKLSFGLMKESIITPVVEYSVDGSAWTQLTIGAVGSGAWQATSAIEDVNKGVIPSVENLRIRFRVISSEPGYGSMWIDDFELTGYSQSLDPIITDFSPKIGGEGTLVTIYGENLEATGSVYLGTRFATELVNVASDQVTVRIKSGVSDFLNLKVGNTTVTTAQKFTYVKPQVTSFTNSEGTAITETKQGARITLHGTDIGSTYSVEFAGGATATPIATTATTIDVIVPEGASTGRLTVYTNLYGKGYSTQNLTILKPTITSLSQTSGRINDVITINGSRLNVGTYKVYFSGSSGPVEAVVSAASVDGTSLTVSVPVGAIDGPITVTTDEGTATSPLFDVAIPEIIITGTLDSFSSEIGTPSEPKFYTVSGNNLGGGITIGAPANFWISVEGESGPWVRSHFFPIEQDGGVGQKLIYVRYEPTTEGFHSGNIVHNSDGVTELQYVEGNATPPVVLPVELMSFNAALQNNNVLLTWVTASEENNSHFEVEMSKDPKNGFEKIGRVDSKGSNSSVRLDYDFTHRLGNETGTIYFRLKQVDFDGTTDYSKVVAVTVKARELAQQVVVAPNPINYNTKVFATVEEGGKANMVLHSMTGQKVYSREVELQAGQNEVQLPVYDKLARGMYVLTLEHNGQVSQVKVVKE